VNLQGNKSCTYIKKHHELKKIKIISLYLIGVSVKLYFFTD